MTGRTYFSTIFSWSTSFTRIFASKLESKNPRTVVRFLSLYSDSILVGIKKVKLSDRGAISMCRTLLKGCRLKSLDVRDNHLGDEGGKAVCELAEAAPSLFCELVLHRVLMS